MGFLSRRRDDINNALKTLPNTARIKSNISALQSQPEGTQSVISERDFLQSRNTQGTLNHRRLDVIKPTHIIGGECIQNGQDFAASVTLSQQRKHHGLGHNKEEKCCELCGA